ncbi:hypothetical protein Clacol_008987 [Clathrus columnatus]|uniref:Hydrophobin n=1 Tax=Clathrus columnatus TaxID=1419009 RepID=A0AAV5APG0_9AGAM|nr:hypothetical protein Clacol_008987 [Clathrus columnatus]
MFSKISVVSLAVLGLLSVVTANDTTTTTTATATVTVTAPAATTTVLSQCNTGSAQCCNTVTNSQNEAVNSLAGLLGIVLGGVEGLIGVNCSPITAM